MPDVEIIAGCGCCGSSSSSSDGGITVPCCPNPLPTTLHATFTSTGNCGCWERTIALSYIGGTAWQGVSTACGGFPFFAIVQCAEGWQLNTGYQTNDPVFGAGCSLSFCTVSAVCDPLQLTFASCAVLSNGGYTGCCSGTVTVVVTT